VNVGTLEPSDWPYPLPRLARLAIEADVDYDVLRAYLEREVARRRAEDLPPEEKFSEP
jgi:hypothetical protein